MLDLGRQTPVEIAHARIDVSGQIDVDEDVECQALAGLSNQGDVELSHNWTARTLATEEILGGNLVGLAGEVV
jgi:hypothetical protein